MTYEETNWAKLSPWFREAHNRLRVTKGLPPIPPPKIDKWVPKRGPKPKPYDFGNPEFLGTAREFMGGPRIMGGGAQGFTINGVPVNER